MHARIRIIKRRQIELARGSRGVPRQKLAARRDASTSAAAARLRIARATGVPLLSSQVARGAPRAAARLTASATCRDFAGGPRAHHARHSGRFPRVSRESRATPDHTPQEFVVRHFGARFWEPARSIFAAVHTSRLPTCCGKIAASAACCASHARRDPSHARSSDTPGRNPPPDSIWARETAAPRRPSRIFGARGNTNWSACARAEQLKTRCRSPPRRRPPRSPPPRRSPRPR